ncbi:molybdopterin-dependent oxidoreductase [Microbacterium sp. W1N]|uniref:molybdopterin-dependent oxidoreductase n=1 Tax=Microbacterium festucae TaxID=2977531 RepID=UPI0021BF645E|nr:molybdopterin-dependent oxidoreductase [Microbacterium festucae]MCT9819869.1 molybdopterin-dependent oxidoreductase [Microbacterium festucae]
MSARTARRTPSRWLWSALVGIVSAAAFLATAELLSLLFTRGSGPIIAVGGFVIDIVPRPLKEFAITTFGVYDKPVLLIGLGIAVLIAAAVAGILQYRLRPLGVVVVVIAGVLATLATVTRSGASGLAWVPTTVGTLVGALVLLLLTARLRAWAGSAVSGEADGHAVAAPAVPENPAAPRPKVAVDRRAFLRTTTVIGVSAVLVGVGARLVSAATTSAEALRNELRLPAPRTKVAVPDGAEFDVEGLAPLVTPNKDFYRVDTALVVPAVDPASWRLVIDGMVDQRMEFTLDDLLGMGLDEYAITLTCVSNEVGGGLVGNAIWLGLPVRDLIAQAGPQAGADMVLSRSVDGYTASTPLASLTDPGLDAIIAVGMNGEALPPEHGFPVRMVVPGLYGYVSATKWLTELKVTTFADDEAYWTPRGYSAEAPIKFSSRIDTPRTGAPVAAGTVAIAGMAWAQTVGIDRVEVSIDEGEWQPATLSNPINDNTWVQWMLPWEATAGTHYIAVRAVNKNGELQIEERAPIFPDGSSGWQRLLVTVT